MPSLYGNLLDANASSSATISSAPVKYDFKAQAEAAQEEQKKKAADAALRFQPIKRPQVAQKPKPRAIPPSSISPDKLQEVRKPPPSAAGTSNAGSIDKWKADDDYDEDPWAAEYMRRQEEEKERRKQANKKRKRKNKERGEEHYVDWDAIYDPERPVRLDDYKGSEEQAQAESDWKQRLHAHQLKRRPASEMEVDEEEYRPRFGGGFAPPSNYNFAPPTEFVSTSANGQAPHPAFEEDDDYEPPAAMIPDDATGDDAYARRMRLSGTQPNEAQSQRPPSPPSQVYPPAAAPPQSANIPSQPFAEASGVSSRIPPTFVSAAHASSEEPAAPTPPAAPAATISRAPVRYEAPAAEPSPAPGQEYDDEQQHGGLGLGSNTADLDQEMEEPGPGTPGDDSDAPRSNRPGQKGFAKRLSQKYGWQEGQGSGAQGTGITTILRHQTEKRKKRPDAEGGGWAQPAAMGKIVGGKKRKTDEEGGEGWSIVAKFEGMLEGLDVGQLMAEGDLMQTIGERMGEFGQVERLFIWREGGDGVFVKFTSPLSAFRAIQASNGQDFLGNSRVATSAFWDADKFEQGIYE